MSGPHGAASLVQHLTAALGPVTAESTMGRGDESHYVVARFDEVPAPPRGVAYCTVGLAAHELAQTHGPPVRMQLMVLCHHGPQADALGGVLGQVAGQE